MEISFLRFENKKKILFASYGGYGDLIFNMAVVDEVKKLNPNSKVTFALGNKQFIDILELNPNIDDIISYPKFGDGSLKSFHRMKLELEEQYDQVIFFNQPGFKIKNKLKLKIFRWLQKKGFHL